MSNKILAVDDSKTLRTSLKYTLKKAGFEVELAKNGKKALRCLEKLSEKNELPEMIITDINMPEMDGLTFLEKIKSDRRFKFIPAVILTTESQQEMIARGKSAGAAGWLVKPFKPEQLEKVTGKFIRKR